jgi:hypothetical protein
MHVAARVARRRSGSPNGAQHRFCLREWPALRGSANIWHRLCLRGIAAVGLLLFAGGCGADVLAVLPGSEGPGGHQPGETPADYVDPSSLIRESGPFGETIRLDLVDGDRTTTDGRLLNPEDVIVYDVGPVVPGDRLEVEVKALTSGLDTTVAVFDDQECLTHLNDDLHFYNKQLDPYMQFVVRKATTSCYLAVTSSPRSDSVGEYRLYISRTSGQEAAPPRGQVVYLNFEGGDDVTIGRRDPVDVPRFSGSMIASEFSNDTEALIRGVVERVRLDYARFNVTIVSSRDSDPPSASHTTVYFGSYNPSLLGIADSVDHFNERPVQDAIIFVDTFNVFMSQEPTVDEMVNALANVASHEIGHLLGLHHTADVEGIMDTTAGLRQMLAPQWFKCSPINLDTFRVGYQDSPDLLLRNVGASPSTGRNAKIRFTQLYRDPWYDEEPGLPARSFMIFGTACPGH